MNNGLVRVCKEVSMVEHMPVGSKENREKLQSG
jgi:hypothetical protein